MVLRKSQIGFSPSEKRKMLIKKSDLPMMSKFVWFLFDMWSLFTVYVLNTTVATLVPITISWGKREREVQSTISSIKKIESRMRCFQNFSRSNCKFSRKKIWLKKKTLLRPFQLEELRHTSSYSTTTCYTLMPSPCKCMYLYLLATQVERELLDGERREEG